MGKMTNVLNKVQESRDSYQAQKLPDSLYITDHYPTLPKKILLTAVIIIAALVIGMAFFGSRISALERSVKQQEKAFIELSSGLGHDRNLLEDQRNDFEYRLKNEADVRKIQINNLSLVDNTYYLKIMKSLQSEMLRLDNLDKSVESLKTDVQVISTRNGHPKNSPRT